MSTQPRIGRREFLQRSSHIAGGLLLTSALPFSALGGTGKRLKVAAVITASTYRSHVHVTLETFVAPYWLNGTWISSGMEVLSMYADEFPEGESGRGFRAVSTMSVYTTSTCR